MTSAGTAISIRVNGQAHEVSGDLSVVSLLYVLDLPADRVAVELNRVLVRKRDWEHTAIPDGASIEIVEFVGGG